MALALLFFLVVVVFYFINKSDTKNVVDSMDEAERNGYFLEEKNNKDRYLHGDINNVMICPHCQQVGHIRTKEVIQKKGVSGGKATAAVLTGGVSLLLVGLSRKDGATQAYCDNCNNKWFF